MKKIIPLLLCLVMVFSLTACTQQKPKYVNPISFYYLREQNPNEIHHGSDESVLFPEEREGFGIRNDISTLLQLYLSGPVTPGYRTPFPEGTVAVEWELRSGTLCITLSDSFAQLAGIDLTLACACMSKTFLEITSADSVQIQAETMTLDGKNHITMDKNTLVLLDQMQTGSTPDTE